MIPPEELLQHADFLRALSRRLVHDEHRADDLVQSTWLRALESPPPLRDRLRGWLGVVARNVLRKEQRRDQRRRHREQEVARQRGELDRSKDQALLQAVVDAVGRLSDEQRQVILMRFYQGLPPREIARQLQLPVETVRTRTKRALANLRQDLDRREGGRDEWVRSLSILTGMEAPAAAASPVPKTMIALKVGAAVLLLVVGFVVFEFLTYTDYEWVKWKTRNGYALGLRERSLFEKERVEHFFEAFTSIGDESPSATPVEASPSRREAKVTGDIHHGVVVDSDGEPIFGARVEVFARRPDDSLKRINRLATDPKGRFATRSLRDRSAPTRRLPPGRVGFRLCHHEP